MKKMISILNLIIIILTFTNISNSNAAEILPYVYEIVSLHNTGQFEISGRTTEGDAALVRIDYDYWKNKSDSHKRNLMLAIHLIVNLASKEININKFYLYKIGSDFNNPFGMIGSYKNGEIKIWR